MVSVCLCMAVARHSLPFLANNNLCCEKKKKTIAIENNRVVGAKNTTSIICVYKQLAFDLNMIFISIFGGRNKAPSLSDKSIFRC